MNSKAYLLLVGTAAILALAIGLFLEPVLPPAWQRFFLMGRPSPSAAGSGPAGASSARSASQARLQAGSPGADAARRTGTALSASASARNEAFKRLVRQRIVELEADYKPFLDKLPPDKAAKLRQLLVDSKEALLDGIFDRQSNGATGAELASFDQDSSRALNEQIRELLGDDGYQAYRDFTTVLPYVKEGEQISTRLYAENIPATPDQISALVQAMLTAPKPPSMDLVANGSLTVAAYDQAISASSAAFLTSAASILSADQVKVLQAYEEESRAKYLRAANHLSTAGKTGN